MDKKSSSEEELEVVKNLQYLTKDVSSSTFDAELLGSTVTFKRDERLKRKLIIEKLFTEGKAIHQYGLTLVYFATPLPTFYPAQVAFSVSKKQFKHATDRNLLKRRLREAYRHQKAALYEQLQANQLQMAFCFIYKTKEKASYEEISSRMEKLLMAFNTKIATKNQPNISAPK